MHELAGLVPEIVVADIHFDLAVVDIDDMGADIIEEVAVMRHDKHRTLVIHEEVLKPHDACKVEIVRRLVKQDDIRGAEQRLCKQHLDLHPRVHIAHERVVVGGGNAQPLQNAACIGLGLPAAELGKLLLQNGGSQAVLIGEIGLVVDRILFLAAVVKPLVAHDNGVHDRVLVIHILILLQNRHALFRSDVHRAGRRLKLAGEYLYKSRFTCAVCADDSVAVACGKLQVDTGKQDVARKIYR